MLVEICVPDQIIPSNRCIRERERRDTSEVEEIVSQIKHNILSNCYHFTNVETNNLNINIWAIGINFRNFQARLLCSWISVCVCVYEMQNMLCPMFSKVFHRVHWNKCTKFDNDFTWFCIRWLWFSCSHRSKMFEKIEIENTMPTREWTTPECTSLVESSGVPPFLKGGCRFG